MLYGFFVTLYVIICFLLGIIVLVQQSKSSAGIGAFSGQTQMLFGGGQDILQKTTWILGALLMLGSLGLSLWKASEHGVRLTQHAQATQQQEQQ